MQHTKMDGWDGWKSDIDVGKRFQIMGVLFPNYNFFNISLDKVLIRKNIVKYIKL